MRGKIFFRSFYSILGFFSISNTNLNANVGLNNFHYIERLVNKSSASSSVRRHTIYCVSLDLLRWIHLWKWMTFFNFSVRFIIVSCSYVYTTFEDRFKVLHVISKITWQLFSSKTKRLEKNCNIAYMLQVNVSVILATLVLENLPY